MTEENAEICFIGRIETPYERIEECPRNVDPGGPMCKLALNPVFRDGLLGLSPGQEIVILYWLGLGDRHLLRQHSRKTGEYAGAFALRTPNRPNPIGMAVSTIEKMEDGNVWVRGLDCLSGTPLIDIKPVIGKMS